MRLYINKESSIKSIQKIFNEYYPFLKIEFFKNYSKGQSLPKAILITDTESLKKVKGFNGDIVVNITKARTVAEVEMDLENIFGLSALIFRKSGNVWVETSLTEDWTLEEQNKEGEQISMHFQ